MSSTAGAHLPSKNPGNNQSGNVQTMVKRASSAGSDTLRAANTSLDKPGGDVKVRNKMNSKVAQDINTNKSRLHYLFDQIEKEFDNVLSENVALKERVEALEEVFMGTSSTPPSEGAVHKAIQQRLTSHLKRDSMVAASQLSQKIKSTYKLKTSSKIFNKVQSNVRGQLLGKYEWHKDGVWYISTANKYNKQLIATASADGSACICDVTTPKSPIIPFFTYLGHQGCSVNCIKFHPKYDLVMTASGDSGAHIWHPNYQILNQKSNDGEEFETGQEETQVLKQPLLELSGHSSVVIACDFLSTVDQCVTASWDKTADIYDLHTGELVVQLAGHDQELTDVAAHSSAPLIVTSSHDTTFRLWDFREAIHSVCVFQGHSECVNSASFIGNDKVVSGSDDRTVKIWDLRNMRSPLTNIHFESPINKLGVSNNNLIAIPLENRNVRLFDANGNRICRLSRNHHERMVTCVSFPDIASHSGIVGIQLFTCAFDRKVCWWSLAPNEKT